MRQACVLRDIPANVMWVACKQYVSPFYSNSRNRCDVGPDPFQAQHKVGGLGGIAADPKGIFGRASAAKDNRVGHVIYRFMGRLGQMSFDGIQVVRAYENAWVLARSCIPANDH